MSCPSVNAAVEGDDCFFCSDGIHWDAHRIGWAVSGSCALVTTLITLFTLTMHATHYQQPAAQRQVMRVLMMPCVYSIVSFFSYRYYQQYEYYTLAETAYESITLSAFLMLLMELVSLSSSDHDIASALKEKDKRKLPFPFNCWRFRASKPYFMHTLSFSVMQYVVIRPTISIIGIICEYFDVLCPQMYSVHYAEVYLDAVDFVSISIALYGLIVFYVLCKDELKGRRPLSKFLAIKLIVFFTFYQSFLFSILQDHNVIKATEYWTSSNVADGLSALCTTVEMVLFSIYMGWAYSWTDYTNRQLNRIQRQTGWKTYFQAIWDTINLADFLLELWFAVKFFFDFMRGKPGTRATSSKFQMTFMPDSIPDNEKVQLDQLNHGRVGGWPGHVKRSSSAAFGSNEPSPNYLRLHDSHLAEEPPINGIEEQGWRESQYGTSYGPTAPHTAPPLSTFPSPRPTGSAPVDFSASVAENPFTAPADSDHFAFSRPTGQNTPSSGDSQYITPTQWSSALEEEERRYPNNHVDRRWADQNRI
ncbi:organic solute transporter Ostalpha-domain-containing protein [Naematelia encephala]|uniref:Organic solute transporter Ostalpha-domain-containing protein n=1 Tax=Naematelia encephala TaxID=71784 RepID=A0A1Y2ANZ3_9TREE|nr:organic solute transporter Ostalpha-domain-containing protein [Naematelia encephala]